MLRMRRLAQGQNLFKNTDSLFFKKNKRIVSSITGKYRGFSATLSLSSRPVTSTKFNVQKNKIDEQNYGDFFLGDSMEIPFLFGNYNNNNSNKKINEDKKDNNYDYLQDFNKNNQNDKKINQNNLPQDDAFLRDSIFQLSDGQVLAKREAEMRKLEKMQEEKEKKEEEERKEKDM